MSNALAIARMKVERIAGEIDRHMPAYSSLNLDATFWTRQAGCCSSYNPHDAPLLRYMATACAELEAAEKEALRERIYG